MAAHASFGTAGTRTNVTVLVRKDGLRLPIHRELAPLVAILMDLTEASGLDIRPGETWGYAYRKIAGTNTLSNHSWATAVDINAPRNPYASAAWHQANGNKTIRGKRLKTEFTDEIVKVWEAHGFRWGGWYRTKPDPMHFEFMGTVEDARRYVRNLRAFLGAATTQPPAPRPAPTASPINQPQIKLGAKGDAVRVLQWKLNEHGWHLRGDGDFGSATDQAVRQFQKGKGLRADGIVGTQTWLALFGRR